MRTVAVIGGSLAGLSAARALREHGFDGRVVVVGAEDRLPYDRPPLSKEFLADKIGVEDLALTTDADADLDLEWRLGDPAAGLDPRGRSVVLASGQEIVADGVVLATGARARPFPGAQLGGVHTLRTLEDAVELRRNLLVSRHLVVIGAGFIGAEVASTAREHGRRGHRDRVGPAPARPGPGPRARRGLHRAARGQRRPPDHRHRRHRGSSGTAGSGRCGWQVAAPSRRTWSWSGSGRCRTSSGSPDRASTTTTAGSGRTPRARPTSRRSWPPATARSPTAPTRESPLRQEHWTNALQQPAAAVASSARAQ